MTFILLFSLTRVISLFLRTFTLRDVYGHLVLLLYLIVGGRYGRKNLRYLFISKISGTAQKNLPSFTSDWISDIISPLIYAWISCRNTWKETCIICLVLPWKISITGKATWQLSDARALSGFIITNPRTLHFQFKKFWWTTGSFLRFFGNTFFIGLKRLVWMENIHSCRHNNQTRSYSLSFFRTVVSDLVSER